MLKCGVEKDSRGDTGRGHGVVRDAGDSSEDIDVRLRN